jgi:hypothetical protein
VHELSITFGGKLKKDPTQNGQINVSLRLSDFDTAFEFEAPKDPAPLQAPGGFMPTEGTPAPDTDANADANSTTDFPKPGDATVVAESGGVLIIETGLSLQDALAFYQDELAMQGLKENKQLTVESDSVFSLVMEGLPDGKAVVVQGVKIDDKKTTITIRAEAL